MNLDDVICNCMSVTNADIKEAVKAGASTLEEVQEITQAGTICGACLEEIQQAIDLFTAERDN